MPAIGASTTGGQTGYRPIDRAGATGRRRIDTAGTRAVDRTPGPCPAGRGRRRRRVPAIGRRPRSSGHCPVLPGRRDGAGIAWDGTVGARDRRSPPSAGSRPSPPPPVPTCSPRRRRPRSPALPWADDVAVAPIDPDLADTAAFCAAYDVGAGRLGELRGGDGAPRRRGALGGRGGAGDHPGRRERRGPAAAGRPQAVVRRRWPMRSSGPGWSTAGSPRSACRRLAGAGRRARSSRRTSW